MYAEFNSVEFGDGNPPIWAHVFNVIVASDSVGLGTLDPTFIAPIDDRFRRMQPLGRYVQVARTWTTHRYRGPRGSRISLQPWLTRRPP